MPNEPIDPFVVDWRAGLNRLPPWAREAVGRQRGELPRFIGENPEPGKRGEELFHLILSGLREIYDVPCVIAGGAVRDLAAGCPEKTKDVDVFLPISWDKFVEDSSQLGWQGEPFRIKTKTYSKSETCPVPSTARGQATVQNMTVDLVFMDKPLDREGVDSFPIYTQRGIWTLEGGTNLSPLCQKDIDDKQFTIDPTITDKGKIKTIRAKVNGWKRREFYKDWKIVEPNIKEWWEAAEEAKKEPDLNKIYEDGMEKWWRKFEAEIDANAQQQR